MKSLILALFLFSQITLASCPQPVTHILEGQKVVCDGYLFSPEQELAVRTMTENYDILSNINQKQAEMINVMDKRLDLQMKVNQNLREQNDSLSEKTTLEQVMWFGLGALATGTAWYLTQRK